MRSLVSLDTISCPLGLPLPLEGLGLVVTQTHVGAGTRALLGPRASASRRRALRGAAQGGADVVSRFSLLAPEARCGALRTPGASKAVLPSAARRGGLPPLQQPEALGLPTPPARAGGRPPSPPPLWVVGFVWWPGLSGGLICRGLGSQYSSFGWAASSRVDLVVSGLRS